MIDGENYFKTMRQEIKRASREIFITDWWLSPELMLKRPACYKGPKAEDYEKYRLDKLLISKAKAGIKIFILLYKEVEIAGLYNNSYHAKYSLMEDKNIKVI